MFVEDGYLLQSPDFFENFIIFAYLSILTNPNYKGDDRKRTPKNNIYFLNTSRKYFISIPRVLPPQNISVAVHRGGVGLENII